MTLPATGRLTLAELRREDALDDARAADLAPFAALKPGVTSPLSAVVVGTHGWLFIGSGTNRWERQYLGELTIDPSWFGGWQTLLATRQAEASRRGVALLTFVVPEKQVVYPDLRWPDGGVSGDRRPIRQLLQRTSADARLIYPEARLAAARTLGPAFIRHNSHWTASGCAFAIAPILAALGVEIDLEAVRFGYARWRGPHDLSVHLLNPTPEEDGGSLAMAGEMLFHRNEPAISGRNAWASFGVRNADAPDPRTVIIFGDSYAYDAGLTNALSAIFAKVVFTWSKAVLWDQVDEYGADIVISQSAERFIVTVPAA